jgi:hypothetical protein
VIRNNFPEYKDVVPATGGEMADFAKFDNRRAKELLGAPFTTIEKSTIDLVKSLKQVGA